MKNTTAPSYANSAGELVFLFILFLVVFWLIAWCLIQWSLSLTTLDPRSLTSFEGGARDQGRIRFCLAGSHQQLPQPTGVWLSVLLWLPSLCSLSLGSGRLVAPPPGSGSGSPCAAPPLPGWGRPGRPGPLPLLPVGPLLGGFACGGGSSPSPCLVPVPRYHAESPDGIRHLGSSFYFCSFNEVSVCVAWKKNQTPDPSDSSKSPCG